MHPPHKSGTKLCGVKWRLKESTLAQGWKCKGAASDMSKEESCNMAYGEGDFPIKLSKFHFFVYKINLTCYQLLTTHFVCYIGNSGTNSFGLLLTDIQTQANAYLGFVQINLILFEVFFQLGFTQVFR